MNILGISLSDTSTASIIQGNKLLFAVSEERINRKKRYGGIPEEGIQLALERTNLSAPDIDFVVYPFKPCYEEWFYLMRGYLTNLPSNIIKNANIRWKLLHFLSYSKATLYQLRSYQRKQRRIKKYLRRLEIPLDKLRYVDHHLAHAASAHFCSGYSESITLVVDGYGSGKCTTVYVARGKNFQKVFTATWPNSLGLTYALMTLGLGFPMGEGEGKALGLAAYGDPWALKPSIEKDIIERNSNEAGPSYRIVHPFAGKFFTRDLLRTFRKVDVAACYQQILEEVLVEIVRTFVRRFKIPKITVAGGVAANVKLNQRLSEIPEAESVFVFPNMADSGSGLGASLYYQSTIDPAFEQQKLEHVFLGPDYAEAQMLESIKETGLPFTYHENIETVIAKLLRDKYVVGYFNGCMEFGPRALGNRSILCHGTDETINERLNSMLQREEFMPFAPATLDEFAAKCYENIHRAKHAAEFMTITFDCTPFMKAQSPATVHVDGTARPQLVSKESNQDFYNIIQEYYKLTGIPSVINTSFNMHGEPIVMTPSDAIRSFLMSGLDYLSLGKFLIKRYESSLDQAVTLSDFAEEELHNDTRLPY